MEMLMYKKIVLRGEIKVRQFLHCLYQRPTHAQFAEKFIKSLFLVGSLDMSTLIEILSLCNRVTRLTLLLSTMEFNVDGSELWRSIDVLPLQSLVLALDIKLPPPISTFNMFHNLSHLDINDKSFLNQNNTELVSFQALTHLSVVFIHHSTDPLAITQILSIQRLRVLAFRVAADHYLVEGFLAYHGIRDGRIVLVPIELSNWGRLGQGDMLIWELAEEQVNTPMTVYGGSFTSNYNIC
ncbi:hypothetical protein BDR06DRAFT_900108 [Suillus hirtellus]|nr:hypothetical protein BDR06DRAFT_900108 [Suillus hirtellus]